MQLIIDCSSIIAFIILSIGIFSQFRKIMKVGHAEEISSLEISLRLTASIVLFIKFYVVHDAVLVWGQGIFTLLYLIYCLYVASFKFRT